MVTKNCIHAAIIAPDGSVDVIEFPANDSDLLRQLQKLVGGYLEVVPLDGHHMVINADGKQEPHLVNKTATMIAQGAESISKADYIAGTAVIIEQGIL